MRRKIGGRQVVRRDGDGRVAKRQLLRGARRKLARLASRSQEPKATSQETKTKCEEEEMKEDVKIIY